MTTMKLLFCLLWMGAICSSSSSFSGLTFVTVGLGNVGKRITKIAIENEMRCVGAVTKSSNIGIDIGQVLGLGHDIGSNVVASDALKQLLLDNRPNIVFEATTLSLAEHYKLYSFIVDIAHEIDPENKNGDLLNIITVEIGLYFPWYPSPLLSDARTLHKRSKSHNVGVLGTGVQDIFVHSLLPSLLTTVPRFNAIKIEYSFNLNNPAYSAYVAFAGINSDNACDSFLAHMFPNLNEPIAYRTMLEILGIRVYSDLDLESEIISDAKPEWNSECHSLFNYNQRVLCVGCGMDDEKKSNGVDDLFWVEPGKTVGGNSSFTILRGGVSLSVSTTWGLLDNFNEMGVNYNIIGVDNHQSLSFAHIDDFLVTANAVVQRVSDAMKGRGIITNALPPLTYNGGQSNYQRGVNEVDTNEVDEVHEEL